MITPKDLARRWANGAILATYRWIDRLGDIVPGTAAAERFGRLGKGSAIGFPTATLLNPHHMYVGEDTLIGRHVTLAVGYGEGQTGLLPRILGIGDRCVIGTRCTITAHISIEIGDDVWFGQGVLVTDSSHGYQDPDVPIGVQFGPHQPVSIGSGSWIGHGAVILPGARIGRNVVVAAGAVVRGDVADHAIVAGNPARVVRQLEPGVGWVSGSGDVRPVVSAPAG